MYSLHFLNVAPLNTFCVTTTSSCAAANPLVYSCAVNNGSGFNATIRTQFMFPQSGLHWLFATVVWNGQTAQKMALASTDISAPVLKIIRNHVKYNNTDTLSQDFVRLLTIGQVMTSSTSFATIGDSSIGSSWGYSYWKTLCPHL